MTTDSQATAIAAIVSMTFRPFIPLEAAVSALSYKQSGRFQLTAGKAVPPVIDENAFNFLVSKEVNVTILRDYRSAFNNY